MIIQPVILAGGGGTRLWPLSREHYPKQFLNIYSDKSLLQDTLARLNSVDEKKSGINLLEPLVICNEEHRFFVVEQASQAGILPGTIILEPSGRNTAPALTCAALRVFESEPDAILLMMPADHLILDCNSFTKTVSIAATLAEQGDILTFGIIPGHPETGYGYIKTGQRITDNNADFHAHKLVQFVEKPDKIKAQQYLESGNYLWNSGIFMMKVTVWLDAIKKYRPDILTACKTACIEGSRDGLFFRLEKNAFNQCPTDSVDYAVMEKVTDSDDFQTTVISLDVGWTDIGSWSSIYDHGQKTDDSNVKMGDVLLEDTTGCLIKSEHRLVAALGCKNMVIIETADAVLVADKGKTQDVKNIVGLLKKESRDESLSHRKVYRPWGYYESLDNGPNYQVKRLCVYPGKQLSLQMHNQRAEHWVVVAGEATVTVGENTFILAVNQSTFIPVETKHRLANFENQNLEVIEVQSGDYLGEDDIIRFDDDFGRDTI